MKSNIQPSVTTSTKTQFPATQLLEKSSLATVFDGYSLAARHELELTEQVAQLKRQNLALKIAAILFVEDAGSQLYTRLKKEAAERVGIGYQVHEFSLQTGVQLVLDTLVRLNADPEISGIIIQKPWQKTWRQALKVEGEPKAIRQAFKAWWQLLTSQITLNKDVDGLHPQTLAAIDDGSWKRKQMVMPATARAVMTILSVARSQVLTKSVEIAIIGRSDIMGVPLAAELGHQGHVVRLIGKQDLQQFLASDSKLQQFGVVIAATGISGLIKGEMLQAGSIAIDVGEPKADLDFESVSKVVGFVTPVPGGVGPMTVISLLENQIDLIKPASL